MGIDLTHEDVIPLREAPDLLPRLRRGRKVHVSTLYRWVSRGTNGVRLEAVKVGRTLVTSRQALQRFADRLTAKAQATPPDDAAPASDETERELDRLGL